MATKTVVCPECASPLTPGRFACSSCGALVASVASSARTFSTVDPELARMPVTMAPPPPPAVPPVEVAADETDAGEPTDDGHWVDEAPGESAAESVSARADAPDLRDDVVPAVGADGHPPAPAAPAVAVEPAWPQQPAPPAPGAPNMPVPSVLTPIPAGPILPPSAILPPAETLPVPARGATDEPSRNGADPASGPRAFLSDALSELPVEAPSGAVALGSGIAAFGFLLPWAQIVIGSQRVGGGYFDQWGLAGPGHLFVFLLLIGLAAAGLAAERLPRWARPGLAAVGMACLLAGLVWPYLFGAFDTSIGVYVVVAGAVALAVGGMLDRLMSRHVEPVASV